MRSTPNDKRLDPLIRSVCVSCVHPMPCDAFDIEFYFDGNKMHYTANGRAAVIRGSQRRMLNLLRVANEYLPPHIWMMRMARWEIASLTAFPSGNLTLRMCAAI